MKTAISFIGILMCLFVLTGCGSSVSEGKWVNFGNGMMNLSNVELIIPTTTPYSAGIKFDNFALQLPAAAIERSGEDDVPTDEDLDKATKINAETVAAEMESIGDFLKSSETYMDM